MTGFFGLYTEVKPQVLLADIEQGKKDFSKISLSQNGVLENLIIQDINFSKSELFKVIFNHCKLNSIDFNHANLGESKFYRTEINNSNFSSCYLRGSILENVDLDGSTLDEADLIDVDLRKVNLNNVSLQRARYSSNTRFPSGFSPQSAGMVISNPETEVLDAVLSLPIVQQEILKLNFQDLASELLEPYPLSYEETCSINLVLKSLRNTLENIDHNTLEPINKVDLDDFWEISKFSHYTAVGLYLDIESWLDGEPFTFMRGKVPGCWQVFHSKEFLKSTYKINKNLRDKILSAERHIREEPMKLLGDTVKPLDGILKGLWRYRIGNYRLIYYPNVETRNILMITFSNRGKVYPRVRSVQEYRSKLTDLIEPC